MLDILKFLSPAPSMVPGTKWVLKKFTYMCQRSHRVCRIGAKSQATWTLATMEKKVHSLIYPFIHWLKIPYLLKLTQLCQFKYSLLGPSWFFLPTFLTKKTLESQNLGERYLRIQNPLQAQYRHRKWGLRRWTGLPKWRKLLGRTLN